jgi:hypothetical protein
VNTNPRTLIQNGKETRATSGNPFPAHPQFCQIQQNSGRGEGLIYNIPSVYFQISYKNQDVRIQDATAKRVVTKARSSGNMRDDTLGRI